MNTIILVGTCKKTIPINLHALYVHVQKNKFHTYITHTKTFSRGSSLERNEKAARKYGCFICWNKFHSEIKL